MTSCARTENEVQSALARFDADASTLQLRRVTCVNIVESVCLRAPSSTRDVVFVSGHMPML